MNSAAPYLNLVGRVLLSIMFIQSGVGKIFGYAGAQAMMEQHRRLRRPAAPRHPDRSRRRPTSSARAIHALRCNRPCWFLLAHRLVLPLSARRNFMKNIIIDGGFLVLVGAGPGALALDNLRR